MNELCEYQNARCNDKKKHQDYLFRRREYHKGPIGFVSYLSEVGVQVRNTLKLTASRSVRFGIKPSGCTESCCLFELPLWREFGSVLCLKSPSLSDVLKYTHTTSGYSLYVILTVSAQHSIYTAHGLHLSRYLISFAAPPPPKKKITEFMHWITQLGFINVGQGWRNFSRARAQTVYKFRRNSFSCQWEFDEQNVFWSIPKFL